MDTVGTVPTVGVVDTVGVALIGAGTIGRYHAETLSRRVLGARLAAVNAAPKD